MSVTKAFRLGKKGAKSSDVEKARIAQILGTNPHHLNTKMFS